MFKAEQHMSHAERSRMNDLLLLIELNNHDQQELNQLQRQYSKHSQLAMDASNPDPECTAARMNILANDLFFQEKRRNESICANTEREYRKRSKEMNKLGLKR